MVTSVARERGTHIGPHHGDDNVVSRIVHGQTQVGVVLELHILVYLIEQLDGSRCEVREELLSCLRIDRIRDGRDEIQEESLIVFITPAMAVAFTMPKSYFSISSFTVNFMNRPSLLLRSRELLPCRRCFLSRS